MTIADAPPPPLHTEATPKFKPLKARLVIKLMIIRAPDAPIGCPSETAPP